MTPQNNANRYVVSDSCEDDDDDDDNYDDNDDDDDDDDDDEDCDEDGDDFQHHRQFSITQKFAMFSSVEGDDESDEDVGGDGNLTCSSVEHVADDGAETCEPSQEKDTTDVCNSQSTSIDTLIAQTTSKHKCTKTIA